MSAGGVAVVMAAVVGWALVSARLRRSYLTAPIVFVALGALLSVPAHEFNVDPHMLKLLTEATLVWLLFSGASEVRLRDFRADLGLYARVLGIGLPLAVCAGWLLGGLLVPGLTPWLALLTGAALAPTDAALGLAVVTSKAVPARVRRLIEVESGLNDGLVTPVVVIAIAGAAASAHEGVGKAIVELLLGIAIGAAVGFAGGWLFRRAHRYGWVSDNLAGPGVLALAIGVYAVSITAHASGFVAAFVAGLAFGDASGRGGVRDVRYVAETGELVSLLVWTLFGVTVLPIVKAVSDWQVALYALLSLTVVRMVPVALSLLGTHLDWTTVLFVGWAGPRGLASIIFGLLALDDLGPKADTSIVVIAVTVLASVVAHGASSEPLAVRYGAAITARQRTRDQPLPEFRASSLPRSPD